MRRGVRYRIAKLAKWAQRVTVQVGFGCVLIIGSHWWPDLGEREWLRDVGALVIAGALGWWTKQQGHRRRHRRTGQLIRTPTLRISPDEVARIHSLLEDKDKRGAG